jgi:hypothetical protein
VAVLVLDPRGALDLRLVVGDTDLVALDGRLVQRDERLGGAEQAGGDGDPLRVAGLVVQEDLADLADLVPVVVDDRAAGREQVLDLVSADHGDSSTGLGIRARVVTRVARAASKALQQRPPTTVAGYPPASRSTPTP